MPSITQKLVGPETLHARYKAAQWCRILSSREIRLDSNFFTCLQFATGELAQILFELKEKMPSRKMQISIDEILETPERDLDDELEGLLRRRPTLAGPVRHIVDGQCAKTMATLAKEGKCKTYVKAAGQMQELFGLSPDGVVFCEFIYLCQTFNPLERYFEDHLELYKQSNHRMLGVVLGLRPDDIERCLGEMADAGVLDDDRSYFRLDGGVMRLWDGRGGNPEALFCQRLEGEALPMDAYAFPAEDIKDIANLMRQTDGTPVHLLLYGNPGTGKTAFARSLAAHLKVDALSVLSRERDDDGDRRASLTASLRLASRRKGSFVLVDEAERLLDTDWRRFDGSKDKAWLNRFLEKRDQRIVWITNHVEHIDQAVLRRFTRSLHFEELGVRERKGVWERLAKEHGVATLLPVERRAALAEAYDVPVAVIEKAIVQGKTLGGKKDFAGVAERAL
ncbi:MAG: AAA family ATPase, partial [Desulfovibrio sp.]|nr:AAA family ATPase [Desulfovibrio sp.]